MPKRNLAWMLVTLVIALLLWQLPQLIGEHDSTIRNFGLLAEIRAEILRRYVNDVDDKALTGKAVDAAAEAMITELHDPHARYLNPATYAQFRDRSEGLVGSIGVEVAVVDGSIIVQNVREGTPAASQDIRHGDEIISVDGQALHDLDLLEALNLLTGEPGSEIRITVQSHDEAPREITTSLATLRLNPVRGWTRHADGSWQYVIDSENRIGYVRLTEFLPNTMTEMDEAYKHLRDASVRGLILDLRENRGGLFDEAVKVADRFLESGIIVSTRGTRGPSAPPQTWSAQSNGTYPQMPLIVLVNEWSASSAEIVAGALRDNKRATLIGTRTYGKGSVQELIQLRSNGGAIKLTTRYYYLPGGTCIQKRAGSTDADWGVAPNIEVALPCSRDRWLKAWLTATWVDSPGEAAASAPTSTATTTAPSPVLELDSQLQRAIEEMRKMVGPRESDQS